MLSQRIRGLNLRLTLENLTDSDFEFTQGNDPDPQRLFRLGRTIALSVGYSIF